MASSYQSSKAMQMASRLSAELQLLLSLMRQRPGWTSLNGDVVQDDILIQDLQELRQKMFTWAAAKPVAGKVTEPLPLLDIPGASTAAAAAAPSVADAVPAGIDVTQSGSAEESAVLSSADPWGSIDPCEYLAPFLSVIRSPRTDTSTTSVALSAVEKVLNGEMLTVDTLNADRAMHMIVESVTMCRFEVVDNGTEEAVLMQILEVRLVGWETKKVKLTS